MTVRVLEISSVAAPKRISGRLDDSCACLSRLLHDRIYFQFAAHIAADRKFRGTGRMARNLGITSNTTPRPNRELQTILQIEECDSPILKLSPHDSLCQKSESVALEFHRFLQIIHSYCEHSDPWLHIGF